MASTPTMRLLVTTDPSLAEFPILVTLDRAKSSLDAEETTDPTLADAIVIVVDTIEDSVETVFWVTP